MVVGDGSPVVTQPSVPIYMASDYLLYRIEIGQDFPGFADEMGRVIAQNYADLVSADTSVGSGVGGPPEPPDCPTGRRTRVSAQAPGD